VGIVESGHLPVGTARETLSSSESCSGHGWFPGFFLGVWRTDKKKACFKIEGSKEGAHSTSYKAQSYSRQRAGFTTEQTGLMVPSDFHVTCLLVTAVIVLVLVG
jgi:hypothetical protein